MSHAAPNLSDANPVTTESYIDTLCSDCGKRLRVAAEHAGKKARCPHCQTVYTVPPQSTVTSAGYELPSPSAPAEQTWQMKTPEGLVYGPVSKKELDRWRDEGRMTHRSQLLPAGGQQWLWATEVYPEIAKAEPMTPVPTHDTKGPGGGALEHLPHSYYASGIEPPRGTLVLVLSILGITMVCALLSLIAVILGWSDLRQMKAGKMDPAGRTQTIIGIVLSCIWIVLNLGVLAAIVWVWTQL
jgi:phage FluMu protein Com